MLAMLDGEADVTILTEGRATAPWLQRRRFTVDEYERMIAAAVLTEDERVELLDGEVVAMPPIGEEHGDCVDALNHLLVPAAGDRARVRIQNPVRLPPGSEPEPDVVLARPGRGHPGPDDVLLLIEVGDATIEKDRRVKVPIYARAGVTEVWIVDLPGRLVEVHRGPEPDGGYTRVTRHRPGEVLSPLALPDVRVPVETVLGPEAPPPT